MSFKNYIVRLMNETDLDDVLAIENTCYSTPWSSRQFLDELQNRAASILLCEMDDSIVGYICYWLIDGEMQILNIATAPQMRRQGIGELLLERAFADCCQTGLNSVWLEVRAGNSGAIKLYQRNGFKRNGIRRGYYRDGEDAVLMFKEFKC
jgi:ribosomal-protein-alanine N-acetyltransferase